MNVIAMVVLLGTAVTGLTTLGGAWILNPDVQSARTGRGRHRRIPSPLVFLHMAFGVAAITSWILFLVLDGEYAAWVGLGFVLVTAVLGITMFVRWVPSYRPAARALRPKTGDADVVARNLPIGVVLGHGVLAVTSLVLIVLTLLV